MEVTEEQEYILARWYDNTINLGEAVVRLRFLGMSDENILGGMGYSDLLTISEI